MKSFIKNSVDVINTDYIEDRLEDSYLIDINIQNKFIENVIIG
jgi:hypothetical protein